MTDKNMHWLYNPNKKFLGHHDLPNGKDVILTIASVTNELVKNPRLKDDPGKAQMIIKFSEKTKWIKPFICNVTNIKMIMKITGNKKAIDSIGKKIKIGVSQTMVKQEEVDCLRVRNVKFDKLTNTDTITEEQRLQIEEWAGKANKSIIDICKSMKIDAIPNLLASKFQGTVDRLKELASEIESKKISQ